VSSARLNFYLDYVRIWICFFNRFVLYCIGGLMNEAFVKANLTTYLRANLLRAVILRHEDRSTYGIPDLSVTMCGSTSWWEVKFANPDCRSRGAQDLTMRRLGNVGKAYYLIFEIDKTKEKRMHIVTPNDYVKWEQSGDMMIGFDHAWVTDFIKAVHK